MLYELAPNSTPARSVASLEDYLDALRKRKFLVVLITLLALGAGLAFTNSRDPLFDARAKVLVNPSPAGGNNGSLGAPNLDNETTLILSDSISTAARAALGDAAGSASEGFVQTSPQERSNIITLTATSVNAERAAKLANTYATTYVDTRVAEQKGYYDALVKSINDELAVLTPVIEEANARILELDTQYNAYEALPEDVARNTALTQLSNERGIVAGQLGTDVTRQRNLQTQLADIERVRTTQAPAAQLISTATTPTSASGVPNAVIWVGALILGFLAAAVLAFLLERLDRSAQTARDVELAIGRRVIGAIPRFSWRFRRGQWALVMNNPHKARALQPVREAYRRLRSSMLFLARAERTRSVVVTSSRALEGKSTTAANLAVALAVGGNRVALVSADLRRPSLEQLFGLTNTEGLSTFLSGKTDSLRIEQIHGVENLLFIPSGPEPTNPGELLSSTRFASLLTTLADDVDLIIVDTPPLGAAADALAAASVADGVVVVVDGKRTETTDLLEIRNELDTAGVTLLGAVLNRDTSKSGGLFKRRRTRYSYTSGGPKTEGGSPESARGLRMASTIDVAEIGPRAALAASNPRPAEAAAATNGSGSRGRGESSRDTTSGGRRVGPDRRADRIFDTEAEIDTAVDADSTEAPAEVDDLPRRAKRPNRVRN